MPNDPMPTSLQPMLATLASEVPRGAGWAFEFKWDGFRMIAHIDRGRLQLLSRRQQDYAPRVRELASLAVAFQRHRLILDGELVALVEGGGVSFQALQNRIGVHLGGPHVEVSGRVELAYIIFDLLYLDGRSLLRLPYAQRRAELDALQVQGTSWWVPPSQVGDGDGLFAQSRTLGYEGVLAKRVDSPYRPGVRTREWLKIKNVRRQEFLIMGWTPSDVSPDRVGALVLGVYDLSPEEAKAAGRDQRLVYAGRVGTGFTQRERDELRRLLGRLEVERPPLEAREVPADVHFVRPELVGEVAFREWSAAGELRHPSWHGLRPDRPPSEVVREKPLPSPDAGR